MEWKHALASIQKVNMLSRIKDSNRKSVQGSSEERKHALAREQKVNLLSRAYDTR